MNDKDKKYTLETANRLYVKSALELLDDFKTAINSHYGGQFESIEFEQNVETAKVRRIKKEWPEESQKKT